MESSCTKACSNPGFGGEGIIEMQRGDISDR